MEYFARQFIDGLMPGSIHGPIAIGYSMVYCIAGMIGFAHGEVFMNGAFIAPIATYSGGSFRVCPPPAGLFAAPVMPRTPLSQQWSI